MMKIIKPGTLPVEWYWKIDITCRRCGAVYRLENGDKFKAGDDQRDGEWVDTTCPTCGALVVTSR